MYQNVKRILNFSLIILTIYGLDSFGFAQEIIEEDGSVLLPQQRHWEAAVKKTKQIDLTLSTQWQSFIEKNGKWSVQWNEYTNTPHRAIGKSIAIDGYNVITENNVQQAALAFLNKYSTLLGINTNELIFIRAHKVRKVWYVSYRQIKEDIEVLFSEVELRISENGKVMLFGSDFYSEIEISLKPDVSVSSAKNTSVKGLNFNNTDDNISTSENMYILPVKSDGSINYHLVYRFDVLTKNPVGNYMVFVDAHTNEIIWRHNRIRYTETKVHVSGEVQLELATDPFVEKDFEDQNVVIGGTTLITDSLGNVQTDITMFENLTSELRGRWVNVNRQDASDASFSSNIYPGDSLNILWDESNSHAAERDAFYHVNVIHNFITGLDPSFTYLNYSMPCAVNISNTCNAYWDGTGINFYSAGGGCPNTGQIPSVVYHEYGHGINDKLYAQAGSFSGMINGATHEGLADIASALLEDDSRIGKGFSGVGTVLRNVQNTNRYPDDISGSVHYDGQIIGGAIWDLRQLTSLQTARELSHFTKWGTPDDPNTGIAFSEWFVEMLVTDDDDGDISNGTPNFNAINDAFNMHGIGTSLFMFLSYSHTPLEDTQDTTNVYTADFHLEDIGIFGGLPDSVYLHYSVDNFQTQNDVPTVQISQNNYQAEIPAQSSGNIVKYYLTAYDPLGAVTIRFPSGDSYSFLVGFTQQVMDDLEAESGWTVGAPDDNATTGVWERTDPQATNVGSQPEDDHTVNGVNCFVTDGRNSSSGAGAYDIDNGKTTLFSPVFDLSAMQSPVIRYYKWYSNDKGASPGLDYWVVDIRNDTTDNWISVENTNNSTNEWEKFEFKVEDYITTTDKIQLRFIASDLGQGSLVEACIDDFEILATNEFTAIGSPDEQNILPKEFELSQNYPNPFNPSTMIQFAVPQKSDVEIKIFNMLGQEIKTLFSSVKNAGWHIVEWNGTDNFGNQVASGIYVYNMEAKSRESSDSIFNQSKKLMLIR